MSVNRIVLGAGGLVLGLLAWRVQASAGGGEYVSDSDSGGVVDDLLHVVDDYSFESLGVRITAGTWLNDLNGRGAAYKGALRAAEIKNGIPANLLARLAWQESRFRDDIIKGRTVSSAGAVGIMQIVPRWHPGVNPLDPAASIDYAGGFLASLHRQFGTWELALKAYNWGPGNVQAWQAGKKSQPVETMLYSQQILSDIQGVA